MIIIPRTVILIPRTIMIIIPRTVILILSKTIIIRTMIMVERNI